jgi:multiple sugar transport system substrate-binding protein
MRRIDRVLLGLAGLLGIGLLFSFTVKKTEELGNTTLVFTHWWQDELEEGTLDTLVEEFERRNPGITVRLDNRSYMEVRNVLTRPAAEDGEFSPPDIIALDPLWFDALLRDKALESLDTYREDPEHPGSGTAGSGDERWGMPLVSFISPFFYNINLLRPAGFDRPPKDYTELLACARAITDRSKGRFALALSLGPENPQGIFRDLFSWIGASAGNFAGADGRIRFNDRPVVETLRFLDQLHREDLLLPGIFSITEDEKIAAFIQGRIGMMIGSVADIQAIRTRMDDSAFSITTIPAGAGYAGSPVLGLSSWYAGLPRQGTHKEEAWAFLSFLRERGNFIAAKAHAVPGSGNITTTFDDDPLYSKAYDIYAAGDLTQFTGFSRIDEITGIIREEVYAMFEEGRSPEETAEAVQRRWEELGE